MHQGQRLNFDGGVIIGKIMQPYNIDGSMVEPIVEILTTIGGLWGYLTASAVAQIEREEEAEAVNV
ncbi:MAG TPA: hypothetical protein V6D22_17015 [Candidatus Obscuribacterales bacterium]